MSPRVARLSSGTEVCFTAGPCEWTATCALCRRGPGWLTITAQWPDGETTEHPVCRACLDRDPEVVGRDFDRLLTALDTATKAWNAELGASEPVPPELELDPDQIRTRPVVTPTNAGVAAAVIDGDELQALTVVWLNEPSREDWLHAVRQLLTPSADEDEESSTPA